MGVIEGISMVTVVFHKVAIDKGRLSTSGFPGCSAKLKRHPPSHDL